MLYDQSQVPHKANFQRKIPPVDNTESFAYKVFFLKKGVFGASLLACK